LRPDEHFLTRIDWFEREYIPAVETTVHAEEGHVVSQQRNLCQRLEMGIENGAAGQAGSSRKQSKSGEWREEGLVW